jgi:hypothetical protein
MLLEVTAAGTTPAMHAFVVGVSHYPFADGPEATPQGEALGLANLTGAARSASEVAAWLLTEYRNPDTPLGSLTCSRASKLSTTVSGKHRSRSSTRTTIARMCISSSDLISSAKSSRKALHAVDVVGIRFGLHEVSQLVSAGKGESQRRLSCKLERLGQSTRSRSRVSSFFAFITHCFHSGEFCI